MATREFELIVNGDGDIALKHGSDQRTLLTMRFSIDVLNYLGESHVDVAKAMVDAGLRKVLDIQEQQALSDEMAVTKSTRLH